MQDDAFIQMENTLEAHGLQGGLQFLNARVPHRFTAIYRLEDLMLHNIQLIDKAEDPELDTTALQKLPLGDSFCQFVLRDGLFKTSKTTGMDSLKGHPYQGVLESYVGLPLLKTPTELYGTLCHFDFGEKPIDDAEFAFLQKAARLLPRYL